MSKTNFQPLKELTNSLSEKLDILAKGNLKLDEIEVITDQAREIYERLVILRFKAYEGKEADVNSVEAPADKVREIKESEVSKEHEEDLMMFDFTGVGEEETEDTQELVENDSQPESEQTSFEPENTDSSLNDIFKKEDGSVAGKFEKAAIEDLKEHIGINRKFLYVNDLFSGDSSLYNEAIGKLNSFDNKEAALKYAKALSNSQNWNQDNPTVAGFIELVERRYLD